MLFSIRFAKLAVPVAAILALAGCVESSTYGTGKTQEAQLVEDLTGLVGGREPPPTIQYVERPNIVRPTNASILPAPQQASLDDPSWPESPQARLERLRADLESSDPAVRGAAKRELQQSDNAKRSDAREASRQRRIAAGIDPDKLTLTPREVNRLALRQQDQRRGGGVSTTPERRFLSEPPTDYRQPASTAVAGELGLTERQKQRCLQSKGRSGIFGGFRGRSTKKLCADYLASLNLVEQRKTQ
ncbi:MAG: hypothetical protein AAFY73_13430 [Pseudomonadota bacterium]